LRVCPLIDKVELRIPARAEFSKEFGSLYCEIRNDPKVNPFRGSHHYLSVGNLSEFGYQAILHMHCVRGQYGNHKLELLDTGKMSYDAMRKEIERIFSVCARRLAVMRVDLATDVKGVPVDWFVRHMHARYKQWACDIGTVESTRMGRRVVQTYYLGKRPNLFRAYDKLAEFRHQYDQLKRRASDAAELPSFEQVYGYPETGVTLTRVERQMGGGRVPAQIDTFYKLKASAAFNPFERLDFLGGAVQEPQIEDCSGVIEYLAGIGLRQCAEEWGLQRTRAFVNKHSGGHAARIFRAYRDYLPADVGITAARLYALYQESIGRQLAA
jgi:hypothetical protein